MFKEFMALTHISVTGGVKPVGNLFDLWSN